MTLISCHAGANFGTVLLTDSLLITRRDGSGLARANLKSLGRVLCSGAATAYTNIARGETKALCALIGVPALLIAALFPALRSLSAVVGAATAGVSMASKQKSLDGILGPLNDGINIGTAIPSGQQLSEMVATGAQNFTFLIVSCWHGASLLLARVLVNLDQRYLEGQTFTKDDKVASGHAGGSVAWAGLG